MKKHDGLRSVAIRTEQAQIRSNIADGREPRAKELEAQELEAKKLEAKELEAKSHR